MIRIKKLSLNTSFIKIKRRRSNRLKALRGSEGRARAETHPSSGCQTPIHELGLINDVCIHVLKIVLSLRLINAERLQNYKQTENYCNQRRGSDTETQNDDSEGKHVTKPWRSENHRPFKCLQAVERFIGGRSFPAFQVILQALSSKR